ncbi:hypothetical protein Pcinc_027617 [Petrolisthes cinctipes]|uniref:D-2-hydroxyglutarate dehydrogenase, mitochondrial n=1 Tax=Petrolisthes cinctipes TaxID=88211 RepID=A0AAE1KAJ5_PETCI|nr:hypothetical protein Pcinc_027617 [Petrolisthes cinctipes]
MSLRESVTQSSSRINSGVNVSATPAALYNLHTQSSPHNTDKWQSTESRYNVQRGKFSAVSEYDLKFFQELLGPHRTVLGEKELEGHNTDWLCTVRGESSVLLKPKTTEEVSTILSYCNQHQLAVCPQGGNTGMVGGSVPVFDEVILSTALMNQVESVDTWSGVVTCQAGCVLQTLDQHVAQYGLMIPLDLGAKGSCHIGGNISTNAGGLRVLRYGSLHGSVLGVEAVLASGEVVDCLSSLKKDNTGYDLKHLFIGSEGTLGIVTRVAINCPHRPAAVSVAFLGLQSFEDVLSTYKIVRHQLGEILSSCEFMDKSTLDCVEKNLKLTSPINKYPFYLLLETSGSNGDHDEEKLNKFLELTFDLGLVKDGTVATEPSKVANIWRLRERIIEAFKLDGCAYTYDISLPLPSFYKVVEDLGQTLHPDVLSVTGAGHIGDGNIHFTVTSKEFNQEIVESIEPAVYEWTSKVNGSISAEHGLGFLKRNYIHYSKSPSAVKLMKQIKALMDPNGILNPYKVLPD